MNVTIIAALISAVRKETEKKHESNIMLISYRLEQLEKKVDLHNNLVERTHGSSVGRRLGHTNLNTYSQLGKWGLV